ncbi:hypothetical protein AYO38_03865 [bacterium SCGC AG-212-C10]|nr:hypothetical protein AYO38_03865 [bacterium SCGC AG-212-C10]
MMPDLLLRNVKPETRAYFERRAAEHGLSLSDEMKAALIARCMESGFQPDEEEIQLMKRAARYKDE